MALNTNDGIILLDTIYTYNSEELILGGMKKLGLDPKDIKYLLVTHAHQDHIGGVELIQMRYGARVAMSEPDWRKGCQALQDNGAQARHCRHRRHEDHAGRIDGHDLVHPPATPTAQPHSPSRYWTAESR